MSLIVGAGPAGISASLRAIERKLNYLTLDEGEIGGTVAKYPRQKLVMTSPVEFPMYRQVQEDRAIQRRADRPSGTTVLERVDFKFCGGEKVEDIKKGRGRHLHRIARQRVRLRSHCRRVGTRPHWQPRKLGVKGEDLPKVMYRLIEADHYVNKQIIVVGGGDSAVEAAMGLAHQVGNRVTLSYRQEMFTRIKERNSQRIAECMKSCKVKVLFKSSPVEFKANSVILDVDGKQQEIPNDFVWIFAGGEPPKAFLKKIGVGFGSSDLTAAASAEAKQVIRAKMGSAVLVQSGLTIS